MKRAVIIGVVVLVLLILAFVVFTNRNQPDNGIDGTNGVSVDVTKAEDLIINTDFEEGVYTYLGAITLPDPCYDIDTEAQVAESFPEQVRVDITTSRRDEPCAQVLTEKTFEGSFQASGQAEITYYLNDELVKQDGKR